jgi:thioesterase domain-containing protein
LPRLAAPAVLFRSSEHDVGAPDDLGWRDICTDLTIVPVGGGHNTMFDPPNLAPLCARLLASLPQPACDRSPVMETVRDRAAAPA